MNLNNNYNNLETDLNKLFKSLNINNKNIFITCNLEKLGKLKIPKQKK